MGTSSSLAVRVIMWGRLSEGEYRLARHWSQNLVFLFNITSSCLCKKPGGCGVSFQIETLDQRRQPRRSAPNFSSPGGKFFPLARAGSATELSLIGVTFASGEHFRNSLPPRSRNMLEAISINLENREWLYLETGTLV